jgi:transcription elongation factor Elf1
MAPEIVDLTCKGCGQTMQPEKRDGVTMTQLPGGGIMFIQNDEPYQYTCPYCGKSFVTWGPGPKTLGGGSVRIHIGGNSHGNNIVVGNGNTIIK